MIKQDIVKLKDILDKNIEAFLAGGGRLTAGSFGNGNDLCCAITATTRAAPKLEALSNLLGTKVSQDEMFCIANGFDNVVLAFALYDHPCEGDKELYQVGQSLRKKYMVMR